MDERKINLHNGTIIGSENVFGKLKHVDEEPLNPKIDHICIDVCECGWTADCIDKENAEFKCSKCGKAWILEFWDVCRGKLKVKVVLKET